MQARQQEVMEYLLRTGRVNLKHKDVVSGYLLIIIIVVVVVVI